MISEVSISNYKSILCQSFTLGRINVFVGRDGSGKTNILEALGIAAAAHDETLDSESLLKRGVKPTKPSLIFHSSPHVTEQCNEIEIVWYEKNSWKKAKLVCDNHDDICAGWKDISWYEPEYIEKVNNLIQFISDGSIEGRYPFSDESKNIVLNAAFKGSRNFRNFKIYNICSDAVIDSPDKISFCHSLFTCKNMPQIFAIDDIENLLAHNYCKNMLQSIAQTTVVHSKQALITTNNPVIVSAMNLEDPGQKVFGVKKNEKGQTVIEELKDISLVKNIV